MRVVKDTVKVKLHVKKSELFEGKYLYIQKVSALLKEKESLENAQYKTLRNKFYNSVFCKKYNVKEICGLKCIDVTDTMKGKASLELEFVVGE